MAALRSIWKGHLRFSLVTIPIRVYNAVDTAETIHFNQIHRDDNGRVGYDKRCKKCNQTLEMDDIVKGYQYEPDMYVIFEKDDLDKLKLKSTKVIDSEDIVVVAPKAEGLVIYRLRYPKEIRKISDVPLVTKHSPNKEELKLAKN